MEQYLLRCPEPCGGSFKPLPIVWDTVYTENEIDYFEFDWTCSDGEQKQSVHFRAVVKNDSVYGIHRYMGVFAQWQPLKQTWFTPTHFNNVKNISARHIEMLEDSSSFMRTERYTGNVVLEMKDLRIQCDTLLWSDYNRKIKVPGRFKVDILSRQKHLRGIDLETDIKGTSMTMRRVSGMYDVDSL